MKFRWDLSHFYKKKIEKEQDIKKLEEAITYLEKNIDSCLKNKEVFLDYISNLELALGLSEKLYCYARRHVDEDNLRVDYEKEAFKYLNLYNQVSCFEDQLILNMTDLKSIKQYIKNTNYERYIKKLLNNRNHQLSINESAFLNKYEYELKGYKRIFDFMYNDTLKNVKVTINNKEVALTNSLMQDLFHSQDKNMRKLAYYSNLEALKNIANAYVCILDTKLSYRVKIAHDRNYNSLVEEVLDHDELPSNFISDLIRKTHEFMNVQDKFVDLKKRYLDNQDDFHLYDMYIMASQKSKLEIPIDEGIKILKEAFSILESDYSSLIDQAFNEGWIDLYPRDNKKQYSYSCISYYGVPYSSLSYSNDINSLRALAHELGHAFHTHYAKSNNSYINFEYNLFLAEISSKVHEIIFFEYMIKKLEDKDEKIILLNDFINNFINSFFYQMQNTEFELELIKLKEDNDILNLKIVNDIYEKIFKLYNSKLVYEDINSYNFLKVKHFIAFDSLYMFKYASGLAIACSIAYDVIKNKNDMRKKYIDFLKAGNSKSTIDILKILDIDLMDDSYLDKAFRVLKEKIDYLEDILNNL